MMSKSRSPSNPLRFLFFPKISCLMVLLVGCKIDIFRDHRFLLLLRVPPRDSITKASSTVSKVWDLIAISLQLMARATMENRCTTFIFYRPLSSTLALMPPTLSLDVKVTFTCFLASLHITLYGKFIEVSRTEQPRYHTYILVESHASKKKRKNA